MRKKFTTFDYVVYTIVLLLTLVVLYPLVYVLSASVSDPYAVASGEMVLFPIGLNVDAYKEVLGNESIMTGYANSLFYMVTGTLLSLCLLLPAGYALSKKYLPGRGLFTTFFLITMYFGGGMIPTFITVTNLGLYNTRLGYILMMCFNVYNMIICRSFFAGAPQELEEAAWIDGAGMFRTFISIVLPISKALIGVMVLYVAVAYWNDYFTAMIYTYDRDLQSLQLVLRRILVLNEAMTGAAEALGDETAVEAERMAELLKYAVIVVSSLPLMIVYPFLQKYFDKGVLIGSVKG